MDLVVNTKDDHDQDTLEKHVQCDSKPLRLTKKKGEKVRVQFSNKEKKERKKS